MTCNTCDLDKPDYDFYLCHGRPANPCKDCLRARYRDRKSRPRPMTDYERISAEAELLKQGAR